jgi:hypothetical protein
MKNTNLNIIMDSWTTENQSFDVNIEKRLIRAMKDKGARFCKMSDNSDIDNENSTWWEDSTTTDTDKKKHCRKLRQDITVTTVDGDSVTGYVTHWVTGPCSGTNEINWFIIQPGKYPTKYILTDGVELFVEDL